MLCNPLPHEVTQTYRLLRVLAGRLARAGRGVMRFDYRCTGDSDGACEDADVIEWKQDILAADRHLRQLSGCQDVAWLGLRAGGNLALAASLEASPEPVRVIAWEGLTHPGQIERGTKPRTAPGQRSMGTDRAGLLFRLDEDACELNGYPVTQKLADQLSMLVKEQVTRPPQRALTWMSSKPEEELPLALQGDLVRVVATEAWPDGDSDSFDGLQSVPTRLLDGLEAELRELP